VWLGFFPVTYLAGVIGKHFDVPSLFIVAALVWMLFMASTVAEVSWVRCPRCGKTFAVKMFFNLLPPVFVRRCVHCGLAKFSNG